MNFWLNVHDPPPDGSTSNGYGYLWLQDKNEHLKDEIKEGDWVFIYEKKTSPSKMISQDVNGKKTTLKLGKPRGAVIAVIKIKGDPESDEHLWYEPGTERKVLFKCYFKGREVWSPPNGVSLDEIRKAWKRKLHRAFNPRINGGVRKLGPAEGALLKKLCGLV